MGHCDLLGNFLAGGVPTMSSAAGEGYFHPPQPRFSADALQAN
jgi:hypothetical protein